MPTPRYHGGSALEHIPFNLPAFKGLNSQARAAVMGPEWATVLENTVIDDENRIASRKGWTKITTAAAAGDFKQLVEFDNAGTKEIIAVGSNSLMYKSNDSGSTWTNVTNTATITDLNMQLVTFNGVLLGFQDGGTVIKYSGTSFTNLGATGEPTRGVALAAFGRVWGKSSDTALKYSALLDETDWVSADSGTFDLTSVWGEQDEIQALANFNGALVIFGLKNIVLFTDGSGSKLGLDPVTAYVADIVRGVGCVARESLADVKGDLWFLDDTGVHSLGRLISERSNPLNNISGNVQDEVIARISALNDLSVVRAVYSPRDRFYLLSFPAGASTENGAAFVFDTRGSLDGGAYRCAGIWNQMVPRAMMVRSNLDISIALLGKTGEVGIYSGYLDEAATYTMNYEGPWLDMGTPYTKLPKRISAVMSVGGESIVAFKWGFDFNPNLTRTGQATFGGGQDLSEWGIAFYGVGEYGAGAANAEGQIPASGTGEYIKLGFTTEINTVELAVNSMAIFVKLGRLR